MQLTGRDILIAAAVYFNGDWKKTYEFIRLKEPLTPEMQACLNNVNSHVLTILDPDYPDYLRQSYMPPLVLFYHGDISLIQHREKNIGIIGMRNCSNYGRTVTRNFAEVLGKHLIVVSGMARGIDGIAAEACLNVGGKTVAVLGSGINYCFPSSNKELYERIKANGLVLSEYPNDVAPVDGNFPFRNRIIAGLSNSLLITEAKLRSGTSITANFALDMGEMIYCVPDRITNGSLCNKLIREGARPIFDPVDILDDYDVNLDEACFEE